MENQKKIPSYIEIRFNKYFIEKIGQDESSNSDNYSFPNLDIIQSSNFDDNYFDTQAKKDFCAGKVEEENENDIIKINEESKESFSINNYSNNSSLHQDKIINIFGISSNAQENEKFNGQKKVEQNVKNNKNLFNVIKFDKKSELTNIENKSTDLSANDEITFLKRHRNKIKRRRRDNKDDIRKKIKTGFFNRYLYTKINNILIKNKSKIKFPKFPQKFCSAISRESNKKLLNSTLLEIFGAKEQNSKKKLKNFECNLEILKNKEIQKNEELQEILNKTYSELFEEYINSKEFHIDEINRLKNNKNNNFGDVYIKYYKYLAKNLLKFFSNNLNRI